MAINDDTPHDDAYWRHSHWSWWPMSTRSLRKRSWILKTNWPWLRLCSFLSGMLWNSGIVSRYQFEINAVLELRRDAFALNPICETCEISLRGFTQKVGNSVVSDSRAPYFGLDWTQFGLLGFPILHWQDRDILNDLNGLHHSYFRSIDLSMGAVASWSSRWTVAILKYVQWRIVGSMIRSIKHTVRYIFLKNF